MFFDVDFFFDVYGIEESFGDVVWLVFVGFVLVVVLELVLRFDERDKGSGRGWFFWRVVGLKFLGSE